MTGCRVSCLEHNCSEYLSLESFFLLLHQSCAQCRHYPWTFSAKFLFSSSLFMSSRQGSLYPLNTACISDQCSQVKDEGICPGNVPRFYFDQSAKRCLLFSYGGCGGNTNNFLTEESCIGTCGGPSGALIHAIQLHGKHQHSDITFTRSLGISFIQLLQRLVMKIVNSSCKSLTIWLFQVGSSLGNLFAIFPSTEAVVRPSWEDSISTVLTKLVNCLSSVAAKVS